jgi:hypothetical protein
MSENIAYKGRKKLLINPRFQFSFMGWMGGLAMAVIMVMQVAHSWFFHQLRNQAQMAGLSPDHVFFHFIDARQMELNSITAISFIAVVIVVAVIGLVLSHRIAGPMYRLKTHFDETAKTGVPRKINFRENDYFQEVPEAYNRQFDSAQT